MLKSCYFKIIIFIQIDFFNQHNLYVVQMAENIDRWMQYYFKFLYIL